MELCPHCYQPVRERYGQHCSEYCRIYTERTKTIGDKIRLGSRPDLEISCEWCGDPNIMRWADRRSHQRLCSPECVRSCQKKKTWTLFNICRILHRYGPSSSKQIASLFNVWGLQGGATNSIAGLIRTHLKNIVVKGENGYELVKNGNHALAWGFESTH